MESRSKLIAFHGDKAIKAKYLARVKAHELADEIIRGQYWKDGKGCAVGCTIHSGDHSAYESELGIPQILARLEDSIFESLSNGRAQEWPEKFLSAPQVGADLSLVWPKFATWMLSDEKYGVLQFAKSEKSNKAIRDIADAYRAWAESVVEPQLGWWELRRAADAASAAAYTAAADAASAAAYTASADAASAADAADAAAYAADAADAAAAAAYYAAASAAYYAAADAAAAAARQEWRNAQADKLVELMASTPVSMVK